MKRTISGFAVIVALLGTPALAAELSLKTPPPPAPVWSWTGFYVGINGGGAFGNSAWSTSVSSTGSFNTTGGVVGGTLGANVQASHLVLGIETDIDGSTISGSTTRGGGCIPNCQTSDGWLGTTRGRLGYAWDRVLLFATGGAAYGDLKATIPGVGTNTSTQFGWTAGAGVEFALAQNWTAKVDYLYLNLQNGSCTTVCVGAPVMPIGVSFNANIVRGGINFKFNP